MILLNKQAQQPQTTNQNTFELLAKRGKDVGGGVVTWSDFEEKRAEIDLPAPVKAELTKTFKNVGCNTYNPRTAELIFQQIQDGKNLQQIIRALDKHKGCKEATVKRVHAAIKKGLLAPTPPLPKKEGRVRLHFGINR